MLHPSYSDLMKVVNADCEPGEAKIVNSRYSIVMATSRRARQLVAGDQPYIETKEGEKKPLSIAVEELNEGKIKIISDVEAEGSVAWLDGSIDWSRCGVTKKDGTGSPTRVAKSFTPVHEAHCNFIESEDGLNVAGQMLIQRLDADAKF